MSTKQIRKICHLSSESLSLLEMAMERLGLSARAYNRILKVRALLPTSADQMKLKPNMCPKPFNIAR